MANYLEPHLVLGWRLVLLDKAELRTFHVDMYRMHPTDEREVERGGLLFAAFGKALGLTECDHHALVGRYVSLQFKGGRVIGISTDANTKELEARHLPPVDEIEAPEAPVLPI